MLDEAPHRHCGGIAEGADGAPLDLVRDLLQQLDILGPALALDEAREHAVEPAGALAAGRALAAGLGIIEARDAAQGLDHVGGLVHDDNRAGAEHRTGLGDGIVVHGAFHHDIARQYRHRGTAGNHGLELAPVAHAAGQGQQVLERGAHVDLEVARIVEVAGHGEQLDAAVVGDAEIGEPLTAVAHDGRHRGQGFGVVDRGRTAVQTEVGRERRLEAGLALLALEGFEQGRFLAADVGAGAEGRIQIEIDAAAEDVAAQIAGFVGFLHRLIEALVGLVHELAAHVVVTDGSADAVAGDDHALDQGVGIEAQDIAILAGARLRFVGVADDVFLPGGVARHEAPLQAGGETGAAATAQAGGLDLLDHLLRGQFFVDDLLQRFVAADLAVILQRPGLVEFQGCEADFIGHDASLPLQSSPSRISSIFSGVSLV